MISPLGRGRRGEEEPSALAAATPWTVAEAGEAAAAAEGRTAAAAGGCATGGREAVVLGPATTVAPGVEVPTGGVELRRTRGRKE